MPRSDKRPQGWVSALMPRFLRAFGSPSFGHTSRKGEEQAWKEKKKKKKAVPAVWNNIGWGQGLCGKSPGSQGAKDNAGQELFALICCL